MGHMIPLNGITYKGITQKESALDSFNQTPFVWKFMSD